MKRRREVKAVKEREHREKAAEVIVLLRGKLLIARPIKFASTAHMSLRLYHFILSETETAYQAHNDKLKDTKSDLSGNKRSERFKGRLFNLLPMKNGFTTSYIPISSMFFFDIVKRMRLSTHKSDGRGLSSDENMALWSNFCCTKLVETKNRKFDGSFMTDGSVVSVLVTSKQVIDSRHGSGESDVESINQAVQHAIDSGIYMVRYGGIDPGLTDVVTGSFSDGTNVSYSGSRYYEKAKVKYSMRRTKVMNEETKSETDKLLSGVGSKTTSISKLESYLKDYLSVQRSLIEHRMTNKYRKLRFLRHISKQEAVKEIVDLLVGKESDKTLTVIGFGNWSCGSRCPISRKYCGPHQLIRHEISKRWNALIRSIHEWGSSKVDSITFRELVNMKANTFRRTKDGKYEKVLNQRIHKVLHCKQTQ